MSPALPVRACLACSTEYAPRRRDQVACSGPCTQLASYRARRERISERRRTRRREAAGLAAAASETEARRAATRRVRAASTISYETAHKRVASERGKAADYVCADCAAQAVEWSYDHRDPDEIVGTARDSRPRSAGFREVAYSLDPQHYDPRCRSCHVKHDQQAARLRAAA